MTNFSNSCVFFSSIYGHIAKTVTETPGRDLEGSRAQFTSSANEAFCFEEGGRQDIYLLREQHRNQSQSGASHHSMELCTATLSHFQNMDFYFTRNSNTLVTLYSRNGTFCCYNDCLKWQANGTDKYLESHCVRNQILFFSFKSKQIAVLGRAR